jgi:TolB protein
MSASAMTAILVAGCASQPRTRAATASDASPWRPETAEVLFMSNRDGNGEIYLARAGQDWINLTNDPAADNWPEWSPDGARIVFQSKRSGNLDIWVMNADGSSPLQLTHDPEPDYLPAWSPDGRRITFTSWRHEPEDTERAPFIYLMNADGSEQRRLVRPSLQTSAGAAWSPDGKLLVFSRKNGEEGATLCIADHDGANERPLTSDTAYNGSPVFSHDGTRIAFYCSRGDTSALEVMNVDGSGRRVVLAAGKNWYPRWSPDDRWLLFTAPVPGAEDDLDLFAIPVEGGAVIRLDGSALREQEGRWRAGR